MLDFQSGYLHLDGTAATEAEHASVLTKRRHPTQGQLIQWAPPPVRYISGNPTDHDTYRHGMIPVFSGDTRWTYNAEWRAFSGMLRNNLSGVIRNNNYMGSAIWQAIHDNVMSGTLLNCNSLRSGLGNCIGSDDVSGGDRFLSKRNCDQLIHWSRVPASLSIACDVLVSGLHTCIPESGALSLFSGHHRVLAQNRYGNIRWKQTNELRDAGSGYVRNGVRWFEVLVRKYGGAPYYDTSIGWQSIRVSGYGSNSIQLN